MTNTSTCITCSETFQHTSRYALNCPTCKAELRARIAAENAPIFEARRIEREKQTTRQRAAWNAMIGTGLG